MRYWRRLSLVLPWIILFLFLMDVLFVEPYLVSLGNSSNILLFNIEQAMLNIPIVACFILAMVAAFKGRKLSQEEKNSKVHS